MYNDVSLYGWDHVSIYSVHIRVFTPLVDDIFAPSPKPKKAAVKKPSFEQLLDDDSDLFTEGQDTTTPSNDLVN